MTGRGLLRCTVGFVVMLLVALTHPGHQALAQQLDAETPAATLIDRSAFLSPPIDVRPAIRWWWPGGDVADTELARELGVIRSAGFGAAEIQSFAVGLPTGASDAVKTYGTPAWFDHLASAVAAAQSFGLKLDLTLGSAWPTAGAQVTDAQSLQQLVSTGALVTGPGVLDVPFPSPAKPASYSLASKLLMLPDNFNATKLTPVAVVAVRIADSQVSDFPPANSSVAGLPPLPPPTYLDPSSLVDLGAFVVSGRLQWPIPAGSWVVFAFHQGATETQSFYGADPGPALVIDHFNADAVNAELQTFAQTAADRLGVQFGTTLRSLFVDSLELRTELYWTPDLLTEFAARRGYRLEPFLPVVFRPFFADAYLRSLYPNAPPQFEMREAGPRVRYDYDTTVSELMVERFFTPLQNWAVNHGVGARLQAHGSPTELLSSYGRATIPETEDLYAGGQPSFLKYAASSAHVLGQTIVSSEVLANRGGDATPAAIVRQANKHFAAGVNQLVFHGFPYIYNNGFPSPGWMPFDSPYLPGQSTFGTFGTRLNDASPLWRFMPQINSQLARSQLALRIGRPVANIALYTDRLGYPDDSSLNPAVNQQLEASGQNYDYVNADMLASGSVVNGVLQVGQSTYRALVFDTVSAMPPQIAGRVAQLAQAGLPIVFVGDVPSQSRSYFNWSQNDATVAETLNQMFGQSHDVLLGQIKVRSGTAIFIKNSADLGTTLTGDFQITPDLILSDDRDSLHFAHRQTPDADYYFITSSASAPFDTVVSFSARPGQVPQVFDLPTGNVAFAPVYSVQNDRIVVPFHFEPGSAVLVGFEPAPAVTPAHIEGTDLPFVTRQPDGSLLLATLHPGKYQVTSNQQTTNVVISAPSLPGIALPTWDLVTLSQDSQGNTITQTFPGITLNDLSLVPQLNGFVGTAIYRTSLNVAPVYLAANTRAVLSLGSVYDAADIKINGQAVTTLIGPPFQADITSYLSAGSNAIEVGVTINGDAPSGMIGPVNIVPMYQTSLGGPPAQVPPLPMSVVITPANYPLSTNADMIAAIDQAAQVTNHVNLQWFWQTPPNNGFPNGGGTVGCEQVGPWVAEARRLGLGVTLQFQTFITELVAANTAPIVEIANPIEPFAQASFGHPAVATAYLNEITCLAGLEPDYLVLGPEMNFVVSFNFPEFQHYIPVYRQAYDMVKTLSPWTQVGLSWQYDGLRDSLPYDQWNYIPLAGPQDFIGLTTYFAYSDQSFLRYPTPTDIPADYFRPIRARFGQSIPVMFTEVGYSSLYPNGLANQAQFLQRLPGLLSEVHPVSAVWALLHDVNYFAGTISSLNQSGMLLSDGTSKPVWNQAMSMIGSGSLVGVTPQVYAPTAMPFSITSGPPNFPTTFTQQAAFAAMDTAAQLSGHVSMQFAWKDNVTGQVWNCADVAPYAQHARDLGVTFTLQFNTYTTVPTSTPGVNRVLLLNPIVPAGDTALPPGQEPSFGMAPIADAFVDQVACLAGLGPDYLVLGPEINFLLGYRPDEFDAFSTVYQRAYAAAKGVSPSTRIGTSYQYDAIREGLENQSPPWYLSRVGPQDFMGFTSYFSFSEESSAQYPWATDVPFDYYAPIRSIVGPNTPVVFTEIGWSSYFANGEANQVLFLNRLPSLMQSVNPANVIWPLEHDVLDYFKADIASLNFLGLRRYDGTAKLGWGQALRLKGTGLFVTPTPVPK